MNSEEVRGAGAGRAGFGDRLASMACFHVRCLNSFLLILPTPGVPNDKQQSEYFDEHKEAGKNVGATTEREAKEPKACNEAMTIFAQRFIACFNSSEKMIITIAISK